jgi:hypothetical protein
MLRGLAFETYAVVGLEPVERGALLRVQSELGAILNEVGALFGIFHHAVSLGCVRPSFNFTGRFLCAIGQQPSADVFIIFRGLNGRFKLAAVDAFETEKHVVQRTIIMILAERPRHARAAFVNGTAGNGKAFDAFARTVRGLFGQVPVNDRCAHNFKFFGLVVSKPLIFSSP